MKKKLELDDIDVVFDPTPLTDKERQLISDHIRKDKEKGRKRHIAQHIRIKRRVA